PRGERPVREELEPPEAGAAAGRSERVAAAQLHRHRRVELLLADRGVDAERHLAALVEGPVRGDPASETLLQRQGSRIVDRDDAQAYEVVGQPRDQRLVPPLVGRRDQVADKPRGALVEDAGWCARLVAADDAATWVGSLLVD